MRRPTSAAHVVAAVRRRTSWWGGRPGRNFVLVYHRIPTTPSCDPLGLEVTADRFGRQLEHLAERYEIVRVGQCGVAGARPRIAITLDDGYADNAEVAAPILRRLGVPATFFVTTGGFDDPTEFWWDRLEHLLLEAEDRPGEVSVQVGRRKVVVSLVDRRRRLETLARLNRHLMRQPPAIVERVVSVLATKTGRRLSACARHRRLSVEQARALATDPLFEIGSHSCSHASLGAVPMADASRELADSRRVLGDAVGVTPRLFAYPFGAPATVRRRHAVEAGRTGYEMAFLNVQGAADAASPFSIPRVGVGDWEPDQLVEVLDRWSH
jgi:peptidoglycan/xylan/chitin deacetylase (PgdA/CDA1 family)